jgi:hypothetical protein
MTYQLYFDIAHVEDDLRVEEVNQLIREELRHMTAEQIREREPDVLKLYHRFMQWLGFSTKCLAVSRLLPTSSSFASQNYVVSAVRGGYGIFRVDHTSTEIRDDMETERFVAEMVRRISREQPEALLGPFTNLPTDVLLAAYHSDQIPRDDRPLFDRCYYFSGQITPNERYIHAIQIFATQFACGFQMEQPEPIEEEWFRKVLA